MNSVLRTPQWLKTLIILVYRSDLKVLPSARRTHYLPMLIESWRKPTVRSISGMSDSRIVMNGPPVARQRRKLDAACSIPARRGVTKTGDRPSFDHIAPGAASVMRVAAVQGFW